MAYEMVFVKINGNRLLLSEKRTTATGGSRWRVWPRADAEGASPRERPCRLLARFLRDNARRGWNPELGQLALEPFRIAECVHEGTVRLLV